MKKTTEFRLERAKLLFAQNMEWLGLRVEEVTDSIERGVQASQAPRGAPPLSPHEVDRFGVPAGAYVFTPPREAEERLRRGQPAPLAVFHVVQDLPAKGGVVAAAVTRTVRFFEAARKSRSPLTSERPHERFTCLVSSCHSQTMQAVQDVSRQVEAAAWPERTRSRVPALKTRPRDVKTANKALVSTRIDCAAVVTALEAQCAAHDRYCAAHTRALKRPHTPRGRATRPPTPAERACAALAWRVTAGQASDSYTVTATPRHSPTPRVAIAWGYMPYNMRVLDTVTPHTDTAWLEDTQPHPGRRTTWLHVPTTYTGLARRADALEAILAAAALIQDTLSIERALPTPHTWVARRHSYSTTQDLVNIYTDAGVTPASPPPSLRGPLPQHLTITPSAFTLPLNIDLGLDLTNLIPPQQPHHLTHENKSIKGVDMTHI